MISSRRERWICSCFCLRFCYSENFLWYSETFLKRLLFIKSFYLAIFQLTVFMSLTVSELGRLIIYSMLWLWWISSFRFILNNYWSGFNGNDFLNERRLCFVTYLLHLLFMLDEIIQLNPFVDARIVKYLKYQRAIETFNFTSFSLWVRFSVSIPVWRSQWSENK